jgi:hypothetical protein
MILTGIISGYNTIKHHIITLFLPYLALQIVNM